MILLRLMQRQATPHWALCGLPHHGLWRADHSSTVQRADFPGFMRIIIEAPQVSASMHVSNSKLNVRDHRHWGQGADASEPHDRASRDGRIDDITSIVR